MTYSISEQDAIQILEVKTLLNELDNKAILRDVDGRVKRGLSSFVVDLSHLDFMNSVGLNFLISLMTKSEKLGGNLAVVNAPDQVVNLLEITKLRPMFTLVHTVEEALKYMTSSNQ